MSQTQEDLAEIANAVADYGSKAQELNRRGETAIQRSETAQASTTNSAAEALADKQEIQSLKAQVEILKNQTGQHEQNAAAVVTGGEGSLTPEPGKLPIGDSEGHIADGWLTPSLLAQAVAAYPYSGIVGSLDKDAIFSCPADTPNQFTIKALKAKIGTQFISVPQTTITLADAESTADKALAWDDIILHDDGTYQHYRSYMAHRTATGYDEAAIMAEHGYTKNDVDLWSKSGTGAVIVGRIARRNQGAYHSVWNPEGTRIINGAGEDYISSSQWYTEVSTGGVDSVEDCFIIQPSQNGGGSGGGANLGSGYKNAISSGSPNDERYDAIYLDDITPLFTSAERVTDRQALLFDMFNKAVAGETFSGAEGVSGWQTKTVFSHGTASIGGYVGYSISTAIPAEIERLKMLVNSANVKSSIPYFFNMTQGTAISQWWVTEGGNGDTNIYFHVDSGVNVGDEILCPDVSVVARPQFTNIDIIGAQPAMTQEWLDNGIPGNWLAVGEEGESLIPDGTQKNFKLSRKCIDAYLILKTADNGATWTDITSSWEDDLQGAANAKTETLAATDCVMVFYKTAANPFELADSEDSLTNPDIFFSQADYRHFYGASFTHNLIGKVPVSYPAFGYEYGRISSFSMNKGGRFITGNGREPFHATPVNVPLVTVAAKMLPFLSVDGFMQVIYQERKHNGTQWGDDNKFNIVDKQTTATDLNGEQVIVGQKRVKLPYRFEGTY